MVTDSGLFQCFASNAAGSVQAAASLKVITNPGKSITLKVYFLTKIQINFEFYWIGRNIPFKFQYTDQPSRPYGHSPFLFYTPNQRIYNLHIQHE